MEGEQERRCGGGGHGRWRPTRGPRDGEPHASRGRPCVRSRGAPSAQRKARSGATQHVAVKFPGTGSTVPKGQWKEVTKKDHGHQRAFRLVPGHLGSRERMECPGPGVHTPPPDSIPSSLATRHPREGSAHAPLQDSPKDMHQRRKGDSKEESPGSGTQALFRGGREAFPGGTPDSRWEEASRRDPGWRSPTAWSMEAEQYSHHFVEKLREDLATGHRKPSKQNRF